MSQLSKTNISFKFSLSTSETLILAFDQTAALLEEKMPLDTQGFAIKTT